MTVAPHKHQMKAGTTRGRASGVMYRLTPAALDQPQDRPFRRAWMFGLLPRLGRGLRARGPLLTFGNQPRRQAIADLPEPIHFKTSVCRGSQPSDGARHNVGPTTQGLGND